MTKYTDCVITYEQSNGNIIMRPRFGRNGLHIGDTTSMGWKVLDIHYQYSDGNYYHEEDIRRLYRNNEEKKDPLKKRIARYLIKKLNKYR